MSEDNSVKAILSWLLKRNGFVDKVLCDTLTNKTYVELISITGKSTKNVTTNKKKLIKGNFIQLTNKALYYLKIEN